MNCELCDERVTLSLVSAEQHTKTKKGYGGTVDTVGERVECRLGLACDCASFTGHKLSYDGLDSGHFEVKPDNSGDE